MNGTTIPKNGPDPLGQLADAGNALAAMFQTFSWPAVPLWYAFDRDLLAGATQEDQNVDMAFDFNFLVYGIGIYSQYPFSWQLKTSGTAVLFSNALIRSATLWSAQNPVLFLRRPFKVQAKASMKITVRNDDPANPNTIQIVFIGWKEVEQG
jgi:hypothetical protein